MLPNQNSKLSELSPELADILLSDRFKFWSRFMFVEEPANSIKIRGLYASVVKFIKKDTDVSAN